MVAVTLGVATAVMAVTREAEGTAETVAVVVEMEGVVEDVESRWKMGFWQEDDGGR